MKVAKRSYVVIEDDRGVADLLVTILAEHDAGADVRSFGYLPPLDEIADSAPSAIVLDLVIGGQPLGLAFYHEIRTFTPLADVPILVCTATSPAVDASVRRIVTDPQTEVILKPFSLDEFIGALRDLEARTGLFAIPGSREGGTPSEALASAGASQRQRIGSRL